MWLLLLVEYHLSSFEEDDVIDSQCFEVIRQFQTCAAALLRFSIYHIIKIPND
jgi:hypothetical protein